MSQFSSLLGSFLLGAFFLDAGEGDARFFAAVGFLGAFTTLSTYSLETVQLWRAGSTGVAAANAAANALGGPLMALAGWKLRSGF